MKHGLFGGRERSYWGSGLCQALGFTHFVLFNPYNSPANERDHPHLTEEDSEAQPESYTMFTSLACWMPGPVRDSRGPCRNS